MSARRNEFTLCRKNSHIAQTTVNWYVQTFLLALAHCFRDEKKKGKEYESAANQCISMERLNDPKQSMFEHSGNDWAHCF